MIKDFRFWCQKVLPLVYDESLSYYEVISKVVDKLNEVINETNKIPDEISKEIASQLDGDSGIYTRLFHALMFAIVAGDEGEATYTATSKQGGEIFWLSGELVECIKPMEPGTNYIKGTNIKNVSVFEFIDDLKSFITPNNEYYHTRATHVHAKESYFFWQDELKQATGNISVNDILSSSNTQNVVLTDLLTELFTAAGEHGTEITEIQSDITDINDRIDNIVSQAGDANTEIVDARHGSSSLGGVNYSTLGDAVRTQVNDIQYSLDLQKVTPVNLLDPRYYQQNKNFVGFVGQSTPEDTTTEANTGICSKAFPVKGGDTLYVGCEAAANYYALFFYNSSRKFITHVDNTPIVTVENDGYVAINFWNVSSISDFYTRKYGLYRNYPAPVFIPYGENFLSLMSKDTWRQASIDGVGFSNWMTAEYNLYGKTLGGTIGTSKMYAIADANDIVTCYHPLPVRPGDKIYMGCKTMTSGSKPFAVFIYDESLTLSELYEGTNAQAVTVQTNGYAVPVAYSCTDETTFNNREYYCNLNHKVGYSAKSFADKNISDIQTDLDNMYVYRPIIAEENGYYSENADYTWTFTADNDYRSKKISCNGGDVFKITTYFVAANQFSVAVFLNSSGQTIGRTPVITTTAVHHEYVTTPPECKYILIMFRAYDAKIGFNVSKRYALPNTQPLRGKKILTFGDSIISDYHRFRSEMIGVAGLNEIYSVSRGAAHLCNYDDTVLNGDYLTEYASQSNNTVCNQIQFVLNNPLETPDIILICAGTNDYVTVAQLAPTNDVNVYTDNGSWIDEDTLDLTTWDGAVRWQISKLRTLYPNAVIMYMSPLQAAANIDSYHYPEITVAKEEKMKRLCANMSAKLIPAGSESGITGEFEEANANGRYLADGLHPNASGAKLLGDYVAGTMEAMLKDYWH